MANSPQSIKRARQSVKRRLHNMSQKSEMRTYLKDTLKAINEGNHDVAKVSYKKAVVALDTLAHRKTLHPNKAARIKSRLNKKIKAIATT